MLLEGGEPVSNAELACLAVLVAIVSLLSWLAGFAEGVSTRKGGK